MMMTMTTMMTMIVTMTFDVGGDNGGDAGEIDVEEGDMNDGENVEIGKQMVPDTIYGGLKT